MNTNLYRHIYLGAGIDLGWFEVNTETQGWTMNSWIFDRVGIISEYSTRSIYYLGVF